MREDVEQLKHRIPLLDYLQQRNWNAHRISAREEFVGLCPGGLAFPVQFHEVTVAVLIFNEIWFGSFYFASVLPIPQY